MATVKRTNQHRNLDIHYAETQRIVATGVCPVCGGPIVRNLSLSGWWQCSRYGSPGFRGGYEFRRTLTPDAVARLDQGDSCNWQGFTR